MWCVRMCVCVCVCVCVCACVCASVMFQVFIYSKSTLEFEPTIKSEGDTSACGESSEFGRSSSVADLDTSFECFEACCKAFMSLEDTVREGCLLSDTGVSLNAISKFNFGCCFFCCWAG